MQVWAPAGAMYYISEKLNFQAVIKSAASAVSRKTKIQVTKNQGIALSPAIRMPSCCPGGERLLDRGPLDFVFLEAALAAELITA